MSGAGKIMKGLQEAIDGDIGRATFFVSIFDSVFQVDCPRCSARTSWSAPDNAPEFCWDCGVEFKVVRR